MASTALAADALTTPDCPLTQRELDVLRLAAFDLSAAVIARRTHLATGTVRNYLASAQAKLGAANRTDAIRKATRYGWL
jgi:two-component system response regulator DesR